MQRRFSSPVRVHSLFFVAFAAVAFLMLALCLSAAAVPRAFADNGDLAAAQSEALTAQDDGELSVQSGPIDMYRLYNPWTGEHFYTASASERDGLAKLGWRKEGVGWKAPESSSTPVHRLYNPYAGEHHYTMSAEERNGLVKAGWKYEGVGWYSADKSGVRCALYREYNPYTYRCNHNFTTSADEHCMVVGAGWNAEGAAWYGLASESGYTGWLQVNGAWRYYKSGTPQKGWLVVSRPPAIAAIGGGAQRYWLDKNGSLAISRIVQPSNSADAGCGYKAYATGGGYVARNTYVEAGGSWYYANNDGLITPDVVTNRLVALSAAYSSPSRYLIMVDIDNPRTVVLEGSKGHWKVKFVWDCCTGAPETPTVTGVYSVGIKGHSFGEDRGFSCYYYTQIWGDYLFHTTLYYAYTHTSMDDRMGERCTHGCVRLADANALWIYNNVPHGTTVVTTT